MVYYSLCLGSVDGQKLHLKLEEAWVKIEKIKF